MWCLERNKGFRGPEGDVDSSSPSFSDAEEQEFFFFFFLSRSSLAEKLSVPQANVL